MAEIEGSTTSSRETARERDRHTDVSRAERDDMARAMSRAGYGRGPTVAERIANITPAQAAGAMASVALGPAVGAVARHAVGLLGDPTGPGISSVEGSNAGQTGGYYGMVPRNSEGSYGDRALTTQQDWLDWIQQAYQPYLEAGQEALGYQREMLPTLAAGPDYQGAVQSDLFAEMQKRGEEAILRQQAARGRVGATDTARLLGEFNQGLQRDVANQLYRDDVNTYNALGPMTGIGLQSLGTQTQAGSTAVGGIAGTYGGLQQQQYNQQALEAQKDANLLQAGVGLIGALGSWF